MTLEELGKQVKAKHPQYQSIPDADLGRRVVEKYPVYATRITDMRDAPAPNGSAAGALRAGAESAVKAATAPLTLAPAPAALEEAKRATGVLVEGARTPGVLPAAGALAAGVASGGMGMLPAAAMTGLGGAMGQAGTELLSETPLDIEAGKRVIKTGAVTALTDLGIGIPLKVAGKAFPAFSEALLRYPSEFIKRAIQRFKVNPKIIPIGRGEAAVAEADAIRKMAIVQKRVESARRVAGEQVDSALQGFGSVTKNAEVFDFNKVAQAGKSALDEIRAGDPAVLSAMGAEIKKLEDLIKGIAKKPLRNAQDAIGVRRAIDALTDFKRGAAREVTSEPGQRVLFEIGEAARETIAETAKKFNYTKLAQANDKFRATIKAIEPLRRSVMSPRNDVFAMKQSLKNFGNKYAEGGIIKETIERTPRHVPGLQEPLDNLLDAVIRASLTGRILPSPSSMALNTLRVMASPAFLKMAMKAGPGARAGGVALGAASAGSGQAK